jgi:hypothetical protein
MVFYFYKTRYCLFSIVQSGGSWELRYALSDDSYTVLRLYPNQVLAADAVGKQATGFAPWDTAPDIPLDSGDIENWQRRDQYPFLPPPSEFRQLKKGRQP